MSEPPIVVEHLDHFYAEGGSRRQVLFDVCTEIREGEIVILTGPSGSGKTTLLTLIGALRSAQGGSLRVLGRELREADEVRLAEVRRHVGYVFQAHNLLEALTAHQNVRLSLELDEEIDDAEIDRRALSALEAVGLGDRSRSHPSRLSGGQRQRVAIARALARRPKILLADEPTASLDRETGRDIARLLEQRARRDGVTVVLVTHDNRILDVADRILALEDGRLTSLMSSVAGGTQRMLHQLAGEIRRGSFVQRVAALDAAGFGELLREVTDETRQLLEVAELVQGDTFESMLSQVVDAFTGKAAELLEAERATLRLAEDAEDRSALGLPGDAGPDPTRPAAGHLAVAVGDAQGRPFGVVEVLGPRGRADFDEDDARRLAELTRSLGLILETWWRMRCACRAASAARTCPCCGRSWHWPQPPSVPAAQSPT